MEEKKMIGKYRVLSLAGQGSFGKVYKTIKEDDNKIYAVKEVTKSGMNEAVFENLIREVKIAKELRHQNLAHCIVTMESKQSFYIVFEFFEGGDLGNYLKSVKKIAFPEAMNLIRQMRDGYHYLYGKSIMHRDLKLDNILLADKEKSQVKISDFGCSKNSVSGSTVIGTPKYMALEVLNENEKYDYKADLWSFALCCWELLYGFNNFPFSLASKKDLMNDIKHYSGEKLRFPPNPKYPPEVKDFFIRCLQVSPQLRIEAEDFFAHPFFNLESDRMAESGSHFGGFQSPGDVADGIEKTAQFNDNEQIIKFTQIKKSYNEKILEIRLCKNTARDTYKYWNTTKSKEFGSYLLALSVMIILKSRQKTEACLASLCEQKNVFNLDKFDEFIQIPNEYLSFKTDAQLLFEEIKVLDGEIFDTFTNHCYSSEFRDRVTSTFFKPDSTAERKQLLVFELLKFISERAKEAVHDYDLTAFQINYKRMVHVLKGKTLENVKDFL
jgi:fused-like protein